MLVYYLGLLDSDEDISLFNFLYEKHFTEMKRTAMYVLRSSALAEEAVHESFLKIIKDLENLKIRTADARKARIITITYNTSIDFLRKERRYVELCEDITTDPLNDTWDQLQYNSLVDAIKALPEIYRDIMIKKCVLGWTNRRIAQELNLPEGTVSTRVKRARNMLAKQLKEGEVESFD